MNRSLTFSICIVIALAACAGAEETHTPALPSGFETVHLGMSSEELREARPNVRHDDFPYSTLEFEKLTSGDFTDVTYVFDKDRLVQITFSWSGTLPELQQRCGAFVDSLDARLGAPNARRVGVIKRHYITNAAHEFPALEWTSRDAVVTARCVAIGGEPRIRNFYDLTVATPAAAAARPLAAEWKPTTPEEFDRKFGSLLVRDPNNPSSSQPRRN